MGFLDDVRQQQGEHDADVERYDAQLRNDAKTLFTNDVLEQHAREIADGMKRSLREKIVARKFDFTHGFFNGKKHYRYQDDYRANIEFHTSRYGFPPSYCVLTDCHDGRYSGARPSFPSQDFMYVFNNSNYDGRDEDRLHCWSYEHVTKSFDRAVNLLRTDGIDAKLSIVRGAKQNPIEIVLHAEIPCNSNGDV